jgi:hypothetical protein
MHWRRSGHLKVGIRAAGSQEQHKQDHHKRFAGGEALIVIIVALLP